MVTWGRSHDIARNRRFLRNSEVIGGMATVPRGGDVGGWAGTA